MTEKHNVGTVACNAIREGKSNEEALAEVREQFPDSKCSLASINWYRGRLRQDGEDVPTARELRKIAREKRKGVKDPLED